MPFLCSKMTHTAHKPRPKVNFCTYADLLRNPEVFFLQTTANNPYLRSYLTIINERSHFMTHARNLIVGSLFFVMSTQYTAKKISPNPNQ